MAVWVCSVSSFIYLSARFFFRQKITNRFVSVELIWRQLKLCLIMYENSSSPVSARQQHEAEILRRMTAARSSAFNIVAPYSFEGHQSKGMFNICFSLNLLFKIWIESTCPILLIKKWHHFIACDCNLYFCFPDKMSTELLHMAPIHFSVHSVSCLRLG